MEKIIHQIWVGPYKIPERETNFYKEIQNNVEKHHTDFKYMLWTDDNLPELPDTIIQLWDIFEQTKDYAFQADLLRIFLIYEFGGLYLDIDFKWVDQGISYLDFDKKGFFNIHGGDDYTIPNNVIGGTRHSELMSYLLSEIKLSNSWYGPSWLGDTVHKYYNYPREMPHDILKQKLSNDGIGYSLYSEFSRKSFTHYGLCSWFQDQKGKFKYKDSKKNASN